MRCRPRRGLRAHAAPPAGGGGIERGIALLRCATATKGIFQTSRGAILDVGAPADVLLTTAHGLPPDAEAIEARLPRPRARQGARDRRGLACRQPPRGPEARLGRPRHAAHHGRPSPLARRPSPRETGWSTPSRKALRSVSFCVIQTSPQNGLPARVRDAGSALAIGAQVRDLSRNVGLAAGRRAGGRPGARADRRPHRLAGSLDWHEARYRQRRAARRCRHDRRDRSSRRASPSKRRAGAAARRASTSSALGRASIERRRDRRGRSDFSCLGNTKNKSAAP